MITVFLGAQHGIHSSIQTTISLISRIHTSVIAKGIGTAEIVFGSCIIDGRIHVSVNIHLGLAFYPTAIGSVSAHGKSDTGEVSFPMNSVNYGICLMACYRKRLAIGRMEV